MSFKSWSDSFTTARAKIEVLGILLGSVAVYRPIQISFQALDLDRKVFAWYHFKLSKYSNVEGLSNLNFKIEFALHTFNQITLP